MKRFTRGAVYLLLLTGLFFVGITFDVSYYHRFGISPLGEAIPRMDMSGSGGGLFIDTAWKYIFTYIFPFFTGIFNYLAGFAVRDFLRPLVVSGGLARDLTSVPVTLKDIGYCFALVSGLLNILVMFDAFDIAANKETFGDDMGARRKRWTV
jgi:hypothetical protein